MTGSACSPGPTPQMRCAGDSHCCDASSAPPWPDVLGCRAGRLPRRVAGARARSPRVRHPAARLELSSPLRRLLPWPEAVRLDELVPERLEVPSGSRVRITYPEPDGDPHARPVVAVKLQECFGWAETPRLVDGRVPVLFHLLSPRGVRSRSPTTSPRSGPAPTARCAPRCADATLGIVARRPWAAVPTKHTKNRAAR